jgi:hypothetical protein
MVVHVPAVATTQAFDRLVYSDELLAKVAADDPSITLLIIHVTNPRPGVLHHSWRIALSVQCVFRRSPRLHYLHASCSRAQDVPGRGAGLVRRQGADGVAVGRHGRRRGHRRGHATSGRRGQHAGAASELQQAASNQPARRDCVGELPVCRFAACARTAVPANAATPHCGREAGRCVPVLAPLSDKAFWGAPTNLFQTRHDRRKSSPPLDSVNRAVQKPN